MAIFTKFGTPCTVKAAPPTTDNRGAIPVDVICHDDDGRDREFRTFAHELRADGGIQEIIDELERVRGGVA